LSPRTGLSFLVHHSARFRVTKSAVTPRAKNQPCKAAMQLRSLTVDGDGNSVFLRLSVDARYLAALLAGQIKSFPQNMCVTAN
jgi:hypothetical protein